jgi:hypothetical protein
MIKYPILRDREKMLELIEKAGSKMEAMRELGVSSPTFSFWCCVHGIDTGRKFWPKNWNYLKQIDESGELDEMLDRGLSPKKIAREIGIKDRTVLQYLFRQGKVRIPGQLHKEFTVEVVREAIRGGRGRMTEVCRLLSLEDFQIRELYDTYGLWGRAQRLHAEEESSLVLKLAFRSETDDILENRAAEVLFGLRQYLSLTEIGNLFGVSRERVRQVEEELIRRSRS